MDKEKIEEAMLVLAAFGLALFLTICAIIFR